MFLLRVLVDMRYDRARLQDLLVVPFQRCRSAETCLSIERRGAQQSVSGKGVL